MKIYIQTDIEGVAGMCFYENRKNSSIENYYHRTRMYKLLTNEVDAAVTAAFDAGAEEVLVNDNHGSGYNILFEELDPRCEIIHGRNSSGPHWLPFLDSSYDAMVLVGMHAMGGTKNSLLPHSLWEVNEGEMYLSEGSMAAAIAGHHQVPAIFASGDDKIIAELKEKIPQIETATVKQALSVYQARSVIPQRACEMIYEGVKKAINRRDEIKPFVVPGPLKLNLYDSATHEPPLNKFRETPLEAENIDEAFMVYEKEMAWTSFNTEDPDGFKFPIE